MSGIMGLAVVLCGASVVIYALMAARLDSSGGKRRTASGNDTFDRSSSYDR